MRFAISTAPTAEPVTVAEVAAWANLGDVPADQVGVISDLITAARELCETRLHRQVIPATWLGYLDYIPAVIEIRDKLPIASITSIQYVDTAGDTQTLSSSLYQADYTSPTKPCRIESAYGVSWPTVRSDTLNAVTITFTAGYTTVPTAIKQAILQLASHSYDERGIVAPVQLKSVPFGFEDLLSAFDWGWYG